MDAGELVPDDVVIGVVRRAAGPGRHHRPGLHPRRLPRTTPGRGAVPDILAPDDIDLAIDIEVATEVVLKRLAGRRVCVDCGTNYSTENPPKLRLDLRHLRRRGRAAGRRHRRGHPPAPRAVRAETEPLIAWYLERDKLVTIDGTGAPTRCSTGWCGPSTAGPTGRAVTRRERPDEIAKMRKAGRVVAEMHEKTRAAARPGVTTAELDRVAREVLERRGAQSNFLNYHGFPAVICTSPNDMIVHGIPGAVPARGGRHPLHRLRGDHRGLPRRRRVHRWASATICAEAKRLIEVTEAVAVGRHRRMMVDGQPALRHRPRRADGGRGRGVLGRAGVRRPRHRHGHARGAPGPELRPWHRGPEAAIRHGLRHRADGQRRRAPAPPARRRLERGHRRRQPVRPRRAHHRHHRQRPRDPHARPRPSRRAEAVRSGRVVVDGRFVRRTQPRKSRWRKRPSSRRPQTVRAGRPSCGPPARRVWRRRSPDGSRSSTPSEPVPAGSTDAARRAFAPANAQRAVDAEPWPADPGRFGRQDPARQVNLEGVNLGALDRNVGARSGRDRDPRPVVPLPGRRRPQLDRVVFTVSTSSPWSSPCS